MGDHPRSLYRSDSSSFIMNSKACLLVFGFLLIFVILACAGEETNDNSLSEEIESSRVIRDADARRRRKKGGKKVKRNSSKRNGSKKKGHKRPSKGGKGKKQMKKTFKNEKLGKRRKGKARTVDGKCLETAVKAMRKLEKVVANFDKQMIRVEKQAKIASNKGDKKAVFGPTALKLIDVGGGNKSALTCGGSADSAGAKQLKNLTDTLKMCESEVNKTCSMDLPKPNMTLIKECNTSTKAFRKMAEECFTKSKEDTATDACTCWTNADLAKLGEDVKDCKVKEVGAIAKGLKACKDSFAKCRKFEDDAVKSISACSKSPDNLKEKVSKLSANKNAMEEAKAKIKKTTGRRRTRAAASTCGEFIDLVIFLVKVATNFPASPKIVTIVKDITDSADPTCTDAEKTSLKAQEAEVETAAKNVEDAFDDAQDALQEATGSTLSSSDIDAVTSTKMARRDRLQQ